MGKKKATQLKPETKQLLEQHIEAATVTPKPASSLFYVDKTASTTSAASNKKATNKRKREEGEEEKNANAKKVATSNKKKSATTTAASNSKSSTQQVDDDAMDTDEPAEVPYFHDSDDEVVGHVTRNHHQRSAHKPRPTVLVAPKEVARLTQAAQTKAEKEAAAKAAKPELFDLWATTLEEDLKQGIVPKANEKGFRVGRLAQTRFRHQGLEKVKEGIKPSILPKTIESGLSFHPDFEQHQAALRKAYEKDEEERLEQRQLHARFNAKLPEVDPATLAAAAAVEDDSWMDDAPEPIKGPTPSSQKFSVSQRNKLARAAENRAKQQAAMDEKALGKFINRIPVMMAELKKKEKLSKKEKERIEHLKQTQPDRKPKLGKYAEAELFPEVQLTEELPEGGALRSIKPSAHILEETFSRFQQRHLIETRKRVKPTKARKGRAYERFKEDAKPEDVSATATATK